MNDLAGLQAFRDRFITGYLIEEGIAELLPVMASFLPASERTRTAQSRAAWRVYVATEAGALHAACLARRDAEPDAVVTRDEARTIVGPAVSAGTRCADARR